MHPGEVRNNRSLDALLRESEQVRQELSKNFERLHGTIAISRALLKGERPEPKRKSPRPVSNPVLGTLSALTAREIEVLRLIADGLSTKEIAAQLQIRFKTAVCHRSRILQKLGVHETVSLVRLAIRAGLLEP